MSDIKRVWANPESLWNEGRVKFVDGVELVYAPDYDTAQVELAALREELAQSRILAADQGLNLKRVKREYESMRDRKNSIVDLQQRLTATEQRNATLLKWALFFEGGGGAKTVSEWAEWEALKPTESGASE